MESNEGRILVLADELAFPGEIWTKLIAGEIPMLLQRRAGMLVEFIKRPAGDRIKHILVDYGALSDETVTRLQREGGDTFAIPKRAGSYVEVFWQEDADEQA